MSSEIDPAKLKVVELRQELTERGLDSKGNKPALVQRLKDALELELKQKLPDTSIADTSTEDCDTSQIEDSKASKEDKSEPAEDEKMEVGDTVEQEEESLPPSEAAEPEANGEKADEPMQDDEKQADENTEGEQPSDAEHKKDGDHDHQKGEKRKRSSTSPEKSQRRRSKSPIKEDEPPIDAEKVQLSWYDSDLHLEVNKESFLSAKPYHDGAFGYAWAGVRATHGVNSGKVCYEVKLTEELKWEDFSKQYENTNRGRDRYKYDARKNRGGHDKRRSNSESKKSKEEKAKNGESETKEEDKEVSETEKTEKSTEEKDSEKTTELIDSEKEKENNTEKATEEPQEEKKESTEEEKMETEEKTETEENKETEEKKEEEGKSDEKTDEKAEKKEEIKPIPSHLCRIGWSISTTSLLLGEEKFSYGYDSSGKFVTDKEFQDFGTTFGLNDVITSFLEINDDSITISYRVNDGEPIDAISIPRTDLPEDFVLFPHISTRNYCFELNMGNKEEPWNPLPENYSDYTFIEKAEEKFAGPARPEARSECEVILMCGLPASGKTHWVKEHIQSNPEKRFTVIGNTHLLEKMTVNGTPLKNNFKGRWNILLDKAQKCQNKLVELAALRRRNYIIDQTNVFPSAQRRKLRPFEGFKRRAVVVVVGDEEQAKRQSLQEAQDGKDMPESAVLELKANMTLPQKNDWIDEITYADLQEEEAKKQIEEYNKLGRQAGFGPGSQRHRDHRRWDNRRNDRGGGYRDRNFRNNRYERGPPRQNWYSGRPGGSWNRDRRDSRGPPGGNRDWRSSGGRSQDRGSRDSGSRNQSSYNRNRNQGGGRGSGNWQSGGGSWGGQNAQGWGGQGWTGGNQGSWGAQGGGQNWGGQGQWKYGTAGGNAAGGAASGGSGAQGYGGNYPNWNYYGQYAQNWNSQGLTGQQAVTTPNTEQTQQYTQQAWTQFARQYAQQNAAAAKGVYKQTSQK